MFRPGRRLLSIACILLILAALAHAVGHFTPPLVTLPAVAVTFLLAVVVPTRRRS